MSDGADAAQVPRPGVGRAAGDGDGRPRSSRLRGAARGGGDRAGNGVVSDLIPPGLAPRGAARSAGDVGVRCSTPLPASVAGDARDDRHQPLRHLHDEVQPAGQRGARRAGRARRGAPRPGRGHAAGHARDRPWPRPDPARAVGHGPVRVPGRRRRGAAYTHTCVTRAYSRRARRARAADGGDHDDPGPSLQRGDGRGGGVRRRHAAARGGRLPVARRALEAAVSASARPR